MAIWLSYKYIYIYIYIYIRWAPWRTLIRTEYFLFVHHTISILAKLSIWCFEHSGDITCCLLVHPSQTDESYEGQNTCLWISIYIYIYIYIYSIRLIVVTSLKCSIGRAKYINVTNGGIKQQGNSSTLLWVLCFLESSGVHILHIRFNNSYLNK